MTLRDWCLAHCFTIKGKLNNRVSLLSWWKNKGFLDRLRELEEATRFIETDNITQRLYHLVTGNPVRLCGHCGNPSTFIQYNNGYRRYCSRRCAWDSEDRKGKITAKNDYVEIRRKQKTQLIEKYGVTSTFELDYVKEKIRQTKRDRYGDPCWNNEEQNNQTCMDRYGVKTLLFDPEFQERMRKSKFEKHGSIVPPKANSSLAEREFLEWINSVSLHPFKKNRKLLGNLEIDAYCSELKLGIEICGLYWHSELFKANDYHYAKWKRCRDLDVDLMTIFLDEWESRQQQVKNFILARIGVFHTRLFARKCEVREIAHPKEFFSRNHIQGAPATCLRAFGLFHANILVGAVSYSKHHRNSRDLVLSRLAFKPGVQIVGGASKLIRNSTKILDDKVFTWSDNRFSSGELYRLSGFQLVSELKPDYSYYKNGIANRIPKQQMQKKRIGCPKNMTEHEFCNSMKYYRIYDCGKRKWQYHE